MNCFPQSNPNPLSPVWQFPSEWTSEAPAGFYDEYQMYTKTQALTAGQTVSDVILTTDTPGNCNFYWTHLGVHLYGGAGIPAVRFRDSDGHYMFNTRLVLSNDGIFGRQDHVTPLPVPSRMIPGGRLTFDFQEIDGAAGVTVVLYIHGIKRWANADYVGGRGGAGSSADVDAQNKMGGV